MLLILLSVECGATDSGARRETASATSPSQQPDAASDNDMSVAAEALQPQDGAALLTIVSTGSKPSEASGPKDAKLTGSKRSAAAANNGLLAAVPAAAPFDMFSAPAQPVLAAPLVELRIVAKPLSAASLYASHIWPN